MKILRTAGNTVVFLLALATFAVAVDTTQVFKSGPLTLVFLGICALIVLLQLLPAMVYLFATLKALLRARKTVRAELIE